jgi:hypothetical protein
MRRIRERKVVQGETDRIKAIRGLERNKEIKEISYPGQIGQASYV